MKRTVRRICNLLTIVILFCVLGLVALLLGPRLAGYQAYAVLSGSMEPHFRVGSIVYVDKSADPEEIQVGDPITFWKSDNMVATHRVVEIHVEKREFITKGDANEDPDAEPVSFDQMVGAAKGSIPMIGYIPLYIKTKKGMLGIAAVLIVVILLQLIPEILKEEQTP